VNDVKPLPPEPTPWRTTLQSRILVTAGFFALWGLAIEARLVYLQVAQHADLMARAERQQHRTIEAPAKRGEILDRNGRVLAYSVDAESVYAVPTELEKPGDAAARLCAVLDGCSQRDRRALTERLARHRPFAFVKRQVSPDEARRVAALELDGVGFLKENKRYYPKLSLAAHVLGYVGTDGQGLHGIEAAYDSVIRGKAGRILIQADARRHAVTSRVERPPTSGGDLELTIDQYIQHIAERELRAGVLEYGAAGGSVIVMEPSTGEILALANWPTFNPNAFNRAPAANQRNRAIQEIYEPGSTFKIVTSAAAIEESVMRLNDPIDVSSGMIRFGARQIDDVHTYGTLSFTDVIVKSSNVGAIKIGLRLGPERLSRYVRRFGFGQTLAPDFRGESPGIVWRPETLNDSALASVSMGYQIGITPLQMAAAASAVANGGELLRPRIVRAVVRDGRRVATERDVLRRTVTTETAAALTGIMEAVVERGTAETAQLAGYQVAGKTGTAAKVINGRYSTSEYHASFIGFVPSRRPALTILVVVDSPHGKGYYGGVVAAPIFKRIAEASLRHLGVPPTINPMPPVLVASAPRESRAASPGEAKPASARSTALLQVRQSSATEGLMPDLHGLSAREALRTLAQIGLTARLTGNGFVVDQRPAPGVPLERGETCDLTLNRLNTTTASASARGTSP
jgi:cell division protein FtsI (penicillin-binding protein 3)